MVRVAHSNNTAFFVVTRRSQYLRLEWSEIGEWRFDEFRREPTGNQATRQWFAFPVQVHLEVTKCRSYRGHVSVVEDDQATGANKFAEVIQVDDHLMEPMTAVDEGRVSDEPIGDESSKRNRRRLGDQS
jgi:hypothetical protein